MEAQRETAEKPLARCPGHPRPIGTTQAETAQFLKCYSQQVQAANTNKLSLSLSLSLNSTY